MKEDQTILRSDPAHCYDGNFNVVGLVNATNGALVAQYEYGPFHELLRASGPLAQVNPFLAATKFYDWETGLYYYGYRYYNPSTGRWLSRDPMEEDGGLNLYGFLGNDGINNVDPHGLESALCQNAKDWLRNKAQQIYDKNSGVTTPNPDPWQIYYNFAHGGTPQLWGGTEAPSIFTYTASSEMTKSLIASDLFRKQVIPDVRRKLLSGEKKGIFNASLTNSPWYQPLKDITGFVTRGHVWQNFYVSFVGSWDGTWEVVDVCCGDTRDNTVIVSFHGINHTSASSHTRTPWPKTWRYGKDIHPCKKRRRISIGGIRYEAQDHSVAS